ncbi:uncharacterized protein LODBEIA_P44810 [Lodderomyces beijingensis]|uniref:ATP-dependent DNA helicase CHL1 n=1 Tax=Lodderomyces beijingensis TaxID=1775926 RepID=A0ABP0ZQ45_9ASCO
MPTAVEQKCREYHHPFTPYDIQVQFMDALYDTLDNGYKIGLFESPTGTGKTLSIICSSMTWLRDYKRNRKTASGVKMGAVTSDDDDDDGDDDEPEWVKTSYQKSIVDKTKLELKEYEKHLDEVNASFIQRRRKDASLDASGGARRQKRGTSETKKESEEEAYLPADYHETQTESGSVESQNAKISDEIKRLMRAADEQKQPLEYSNQNCPTKIFFTSRTHSQLNQFSSQLRLTSFQASFEDLQERTKYLPLGSRKQLCVNAKVSKRKTGEQNINDACIDLQKTKDGCSYLHKNLASSSLTREFVDLSLAQIRDIEDLADLGSHLHLCPYYSLRQGTSLAEIASLPYQLLIENGSRKVWNLDLRDSIVIIDEAHNIFDAITSMNSVSITMEQLARTIKALKIYLSKFSKKLNTGNRVNLMKLVKVCNLLLSFMGKATSSASAGDEIQSEAIFSDSTGDLVNIHQIDHYLSKSKIAFKLESYMEKVDENYRASKPVLFDIIQFLKCLTNPAKEGRFFWDKGKDGELVLKYLLLDPSTIFKDIVDQAKCVILCGGTIEPSSDFTDYLFPQVPSEKIRKFSCGHIIPENNLQVIPVSQYRQGKEATTRDFEFSYSRRNDTQQIRNLGELIIEICQNVPHGVVVFFSSYKVLAEILQIWRSSSIYTRLNQLKQIFEECSGSSRGVDSILHNYSHTINTNAKGGAILLAVVGGKMSEGINFSDKLARAVIMVGLPYPNAFSGELVARRNFIEEQVIAKGGTRHQAKLKSAEYYDNLCMKAVNQTPQGSKTS